MNDIIDLKLTGIAHGGEALGKLEQRVIFVAYALPGERVRVQITESHKRWARARLLEILEPSPSRVPPQCPMFGPQGCGGCQWQHVQPDTQLDYLRRVLKDALQRLGGLKNPLVRKGRSAGPAWRYRTRAHFRASGQGGLGLNKPQSRQVQALETCPLLAPDLDALYQEFNVAWDGLRSVEMMVGRDSGDKMVILRTRNDALPLLEVDFPVSILLARHDGTMQPLLGETHYFETIAGYTYRFGPQAPGPTNIAAAEQIIQQTRAYLRARPGQVLMDVYSGSGLFLQGLAEHVSMVIGIEEDLAAMENAAFSCSHLDNVALHEGPPAKVLRKLLDPIDLAIVSPPDEGLGHRIAPNLARLGARRLVYITENPATLARDLPQLQRANYRFLEATPIHTAPQTYHFTTVALFTR